MDLQLLILSVISIWLLILTAIVFNIYLFFKRLSQNVNAGNIRDVLEDLVKREKINLESIKGLKGEVARIDAEGLLHIQKVGFLRFNPFEEVGGDHSFSVALLDGKDGGVIITGLHTRERTRVYVKKIKNGKSDIELSAEEKKVLKIAIKN